ncbi:molecular chaperone [Pseudomonas rubra]|uniref:Fimbria/pilus periplasmic chaperone n=1 Tax=Pseudomonas rubra TaxID=2942627 RepID=A0ABT5P8V1_9PSED|nr:fimbria/pilus periplasmic chaperone [Pseudomonas rubra]MDD1014617.1 fimbria/pilus periplasmic chaperone [Pseudomonas rubra]MDD1040566.1 fimbria/pilus periplasmic chaperone [Pseudomonas rubra]MDD1153590.1 fimbria/pilus periplasmic chaperone [Pseudomonas rubra]
MTSITKLLLLAVTWLSCIATVQASVVISNTRIIFPAEQGEATIGLENKAKNPTLVQAWLDDGDSKATPETIQVPFIVTPAIARIEGGKGQTVRLLHNGTKMAQDRETLYWFNLLEVPPKAEGENYLQFAFRSRIKVLYRPAKLPGHVNESANAINWTLVRSNDKWTLKADNPTAYFVNIGHIEIDSNGHKLAFGSGHIAPFASETFSASEQLKTPPTSPIKVNFTSINDHGAGEDNAATAVYSKPL